MDYFSSMPRPLPISLVQAPPRPVGDGGFAGEVEDVLGRFPDTRLAAFPELHPCGADGEGDGRTQQPRPAAQPLHGPRIKELAELAGGLGIWLAPGTVCEEGDHGELFNKAPVFFPRGGVAGWDPQG